jgi:hypothetical protein
LPVAFCLLPNRRGKTYTELFERLKEQATVMGKQFNPKRIVTDYEPGLLPVMEQEVSVLYLDNTRSACVKYCSIFVSFLLPFTLDACFISIKQFIGELEI